MPPTIDNDSIRHGLTDHPAPDSALPARAQSPRPRTTAGPKVVVVMPAYNAAKTLHLTYADLPHELIDLIIVVDDGSSDQTAKIARALGLELFVHNRNYGYGANQKTCYREALRAGADIVVMVHPDYQYDPRLLPQVIQPIQNGAADVVLGSRLLGSNPVSQGMPWWKYLANRFLTAVENFAFGLNLSEYHTGYRAFRADALEFVNFQMNSDNFVFDQEILAQMVALHLRITEIPVPTRYFPQASSASFIQSSVYGVSILWLLCKYLLHKSRIIPQQQFRSLRQRYSHCAAACETPAITSNNSMAETTDAGRTQLTA